MESEGQEDSTVSFKELKKRWAQHETTLRQEGSSLENISKTSPTPIQTDNHTQSAIISPPQEPVRTSSAPPLPPKPNIVHTTSVAEKSQAHFDSVRRVSLLAQQFNAKTALGASPGTGPEIPSISSNTEQQVSSPAPTQIPLHDPFSEEELQSGTSDTDSEGDTGSTSSGESDMDDTLIHQVQTSHIIHSSPEHDMSLKGIEQQRRIPPKPSQSTTKARSPPPPPPLSKKYHGSVNSHPPLPPPPPQSRAIQIDRSAEVTPPILPPRPVLAEGPSVPILPPRPSSSSIARSNTVTATGRSSQGGSFASSANNVRRALTTVRRGIGHPALLMSTSVYPDFTNASRKPPVGNSAGQRLGGSKHTVYTIAAAGSTLAIGGHTTRIWDIEKNACLYAVDPAMPNDNNDKVRSMAFAPCRNPANEGHYLWVGMQDGMLMVLDASRQMILGKRANFHSAPVQFIMRHKNTEVWTIDESGSLKIWPALAVDCDQHDPLDLNPGKCQVTSKAVAAVKVDSCLFMSSGRTLEYHTIPLSQNPVRKRIPNDLGNITQLAAVPYHYHRIFASHDNGKISIWDSESIERLQVITVSMYGISAMVGVGDYYLWVGYNTGMIYVYDTRPEQWLVVKVWKAHTSAVSCMVVDDTGLILDRSTVQVVSTDSSGNIAYWDGLLTDDWQEQRLHAHVREYCDYRDIEVMICSWNIDATKPEKLANTDDDIKLHEWLKGMKNPDIIVVGMQEIVDLESKKQTARSLFASRKKIETLQDADELLTHRYSLWHDYLVQAVAQNYGEHAYIVKKTDQLVGLFSCIFVKSSLGSRISNCESTLVKTGMKVMNRSLHGNKGGIAVRFLLDDTSLCFVNCHLAAGQSHIQQRNADAEGILQTTAFSAHETPDIFTNGGDGSLVLDHEVCFLSGDLNYRIGMSREDVIRELKNPDQQAARERLMAEDQLLKQRHTNPLFKLLTFQEPLIEFNPTYKYDPGTNCYDSSDKKRVPAWCDRILYHGESIQNLYYRRHEVLASDHRPISAGYSLEVKYIDYGKRDAIQKKIPEAWRKHLLEIVKSRKTLYVADYDACSLSEAHSRLEANQWNVQQTVEDLYE